MPHQPQGIQFELARISRAARSMIAPVNKRKSIPMIPSSGVEKDSMELKLLSCETKRDLKVG
jgi:hypothetical protein